VAQPAILFGKLVARLESTYGRPKPPKSDPFELILWENVAYLLNDEKREAAFEALRDPVGLTPKSILAAPQATLLDIAKMGGMRPEVRVERLRSIARITLDQFQGDLRKALKLPLKQAKKALQLYPNIGEPGAEKILLFTKSYPVLGLDSNGLRVLHRIGYGQECKNYSATYHSVQEAVAGEIGQECGPLIKANQLLRQHGQERCKLNAPLCRICPVTDLCAYYKGGTICAPRTRSS
jgi:endonuclease-3